MKLTFNDNGTTQRSFTKDGYLVVPASLSRVGVFDYAKSELNQSGSGVAKIARTEKSLFTDATIKSFENAPITLGHPKEDVTAKNWKQLAVGTMRNVVRDGDSLSGEAWIYDETAIKTIQEQGVKELSCGYACDLLDGKDAGADFEMSPMIGNHIAIVANGRCGNSCKLADEGKSKMSKTRKMLDALLGTFGIKLTDEQAKKVDEDEKETGEEKGGEKPAEKTEPKPETKTKSEEKSDDEDKDKEKKKMADEDLKAKVAALEAENQRLKDENAVEAQRQAVLADAKANFAQVQFADSANIREIHESAVISTGIFAKDELAKLGDEELAGAYKTAKATAKKLADRQLGGALLNDSNAPQTFDFNSYAKQGAK